MYSQTIFYFLGAGVAADISFFLVQSVATAAVLSFRKNTPKRPEYIEALRHVFSEGY